MGILLVSCGTDGNGGDDASADGTDVGPVNFELPDGVEEVFRDEGATEGWVAEFSDDDQDPGAFIGVFRFPETPPSASAGAAEMRVQVRLAETHPGIQISDGGSVDIAGADDVYVMDLSAEDDDVEITGRWWILLDHNNEVAAAVELYGPDVDDGDIDSFAETLELNADQDW